MSNWVWLELPESLSLLRYIDSYYVDNKSKRWKPPTKDEIYYLINILRIIHTLSYNSPGIFGKSEDIGNILSIFVLNGIAGNGTWNLSKKI